MFSQQNGDSQNLVQILTSQPENPFRDYLVCEKQLALPGFCDLNA